MFTGLRVIHGHEQLSRAPAYDATRWSYPEADLLANRLCHAVEAFPIPWRWAMWCRAKQQARRHGIPLTAVQERYTSQIVQVVEG
jgi:hypothetical protein